MLDLNKLSFLHILYVEDEVMTRDELSRFLKRRVSKLSVAQNGLEALTIFEKQAPDILITDLRMPDMDGLELTKRVRELGFETPIIITSALSDSDTILTAVDRGIMKYMVKPIDAVTLEETLLQIANQISSRNRTEIGKTSELSADEKQQLEKILARDISALLKSATGKGPRRIKVTLSHNKAQLQIEGMLTPMENTLIRGAQSPEALTLNRELLYKTLSLKLSTIFKSHLDHPVFLSHYAGRLREDKEEVFFSFNRT